MQFRPRQILIQLFFIDENKTVRAKAETKADTVTFKTRSQNQEETKTVTCKLQDKDKTLALLTFKTNEQKQ